MSATYPRSSEGKAPACKKDIISPSYHQKLLLKKGSLSLNIESKNIDFKKRSPRSGKNQESEEERQEVFEINEKPPKYFDEKELRIYRWLDDEKINQADPKEREYNYFEQRRKFIFHKNSSDNNSTLSSRTLEMTDSSLMKKRRFTSSVKNLTLASPDTPVTIYII
jgi:hypothetical protein